MKASVEVATPQEGASGLVAAGVRKAMTSIVNQWLDVQQDSTALAKF